MPSLAYITLLGATVVGGHSDHRGVCSVHVKASATAVAIPKNRWHLLWAMREAVTKNTPAEIWFKRAESINLWNQFVATFYVNESRHSDPDN